MESQLHIKQLLKTLTNQSAEEIIAFIAKEFKDKIVFASSFGEEDQVITDIIARVSPGITIFTLDTGRLFSETYELIAKTQKKYPQLKFKIYYPDTQSVEQMVQQKGINLFYESIENRKLCCGIRKVQPLQRALVDADAWIVGLRRDQSVTRSHLEIIEYDAEHNKIKINPLLHWSLDQVHDYIKTHDVDVNPLHSLGFVSIGCSPCTRAIKPGEDIRAGRWWWEDPNQKECGLHQNPNWKGNQK